MGDIQSMTGFGKGESQNENFSVTVEIKTVNNRYRDFRFRMSNLFNAQEMSFRKTLEKHFRRGSFDISINYRYLGESRRFDNIDEGKVNAFIEKMKGILAPQGIGLQINPTDFFRHEFVQDEDSRGEELLPLVEKSLKIAIKELEISRLDEGKKLKDVILGFRKDYEQKLEVIKQEASSYEENVKKRLQERFQKLDDSNVSIDEGRFMQEVIYYLEKLDIQEEIERIGIHLQKLDKLLGSEGEIGRQVDFLLQELNRETNTIGSKSGNSNQTDAVVQMKVFLEKIREQALNIE